MAAKTNAKVDSKAQNLKERGTQDDLEIMRLILKENPILEKKVLDKIRAHRRLTSGELDGNLKVRADDLKKMRG